MGLCLSCMWTLSLPALLKSGTVPSQVLASLAEMFDKQQANTIFWSPQGQFVVLAGLRRWVGALPAMATPCS